MTDMKKLIAVFGSLLAVVVLLIVYFQGIPVKSKFNKEFGADYRLPVEYVETQETFPENWRSYSIGGAEFYAPDGLEYNEQDKRFENDDMSVVVCVFSDENSRADSIDKLLADCGINRDEMEWFCEKEKKDFPRDEYEFVKFVYFLTEDDLNVHSRKSADIFYKLFSEREEGCSGFSYISNYEYNGFVVDIDSEEIGEPVSVAKIYGDQRKVYRITAVCGDKDLNFEIARSLRLSE